VEIGIGTGKPIGPRRLARRLGGAASPVFSICAMVTDWDEYAACLASFATRGFDDDQCEFIVLDNSQGNTADAYVALNEFLQAASGRYVILCHQDIVLLDHGIIVLEERLAELTDLDPYWAVCGNAGYAEDGWPQVNLAHGGRDYIDPGKLPARVVSLDENFLVVRREANLAVSRDLQGFHHYGPDLCIVADILGWNAYVIDFYLQHNSSGTVDDRYHQSRERIAAKYQRALRPRWISIVTMRPFLLSGWALHHRIANVQHFGRKLFGLYPRGPHLADSKRRARRDAARSGRNGS